MYSTRRSIGALAVLAVACGLSLGAAPIAAATGTPNMSITASGGDGTAVDHDGTQGSVDHDGTQGSFTDSVQGAADSDGDQDARDLTSSEMATDGMLKSPSATKK